MVRETINNVVKSLITHKSILSIGLSSIPLPQSKRDGDIDVFIYCDDIIPANERRALYPGQICHSDTLKIHVFDSEIWGNADYTEIEGIETWLMYFKASHVIADFHTIIAGRQVKRRDGYYPSGRLAMFKNIEILYDKHSLLQRFKQELESFPASFKTSIIHHCVEKLEDHEDLERACARKDVLFFHLALDDALDSLVQLLFALNEAYFPSRKRNMEYLQHFTLIPKNICNRLYTIIQLSANENTIASAYEELKALQCDVKNIVNI